MKTLKLIAVAGSFLPLLAVADTEVIVLSNNAGGDAYTAPTNTFIPILSQTGMGYNNIRAGSSTGIDTLRPRSGNGSVNQSLSDGNGKADLEYYSLSGSTPLSMGKLADVTSFGYDYFRSSASTNAAFQVPGLRLLVDGDGSLATTNDQGYLIYEPLYTNQPSNPSWTAPTDQWVTDGTTQTTGFFWAKKFGAPLIEQFNRTLQDWTTNTYSGENWTITSNATVFGFSSGIGSGWNGAYAGSIDNIRLGFSGGDVTRYNFEAVPEPASIAALGLGALGFLRRRRAR